MKHYHFIGIGGIGMSGIARLMLEQGFSISGSDIACSPILKELEEKGAKIYLGHAKENIHPETIVVYSSDIKKDNPEYNEAKEKGLLILHRADLLASEAHKKKGIAVAGTHGKTTTSSLLATVLMHADSESGFAVGGILANFKVNSRWGTGDLFAFEANESDQSFLKYHPFGAIITNIDEDHLSNYQGKKELLIEAFYSFANQVVSPPHLFYWYEDPFLSELELKGQSYGFSPEADWFIQSHSQEGFRSYFDFRHNSHVYRSLEIPLSGKHNILNAAAVFGLAISLGISEEKIREAFLTFKGVGRRCEKRAVVGSIDFFDDYAHHPTEIKTTLNGIRKAIGERSLIVIFQPHRYSRIQECLGQFSNVFDAASHVILTDIYGAGEEPIPQLSSLDILKEIEVPATYVERTKIPGFLSTFLKENDFVITLGAGDVTKIATEWTSLLEQTR